MEGEQILTYTGKSVLLCMLSVVPALFLLGCSLTFWRQNEKHFNKRRRCFLHQTKVRAHWKTALQMSTCDPAYMETVAHRVQHRVRYWRSGVASHWLLARRRRGQKLGTSLVLWWSESSNFPPGDLLKVDGSSLSQRTAWRCTDTTEQQQVAANTRNWATSGPNKWTNWKHNPEVWKCT